MVTLKFFQADWCGPCKQQKPIVNDLDDERDDVDVKRLDVEDDVDEANKYQVRSVPSIVVETDDGVVDRFTGLTQRDDLETAIADAH